MDANLTLATLLLASVAAFALAWISAVAGFGGGVLLLPIFASLFGLRVAVPVLTITALASNGGRVWFNRHEVKAGLVGWFSLGAVPAALVGGLVFARAPLEPLRRLLGLFLLGSVAWRRFGRSPRRPSDHSFVAVGGASGFGSALVGTVGPITAPFFLAYGLTKGAYIGTEAASALIMHCTKLVAYGIGDILDAQILLLGAALTPATVLGSWAGKRTVDRLSVPVFTALVEIGLVVAGLTFLIF